MSDAIEVMARAMTRARVLCNAKLDNIKPDEAWLARVIESGWSAWVSDAEVLTQALRAEGYVVASSEPEIGSQPDG